MKEIPSTDDLTRSALEHTQGLSAADYDPNDWYGNILSDETHGKSQNWDNASSGFIPANAVGFIKEIAKEYDNICEGVGAGIAQVVSYSLQELKEYSGNDTDFAVSHIVGVAKKISGRFGRGAAAEIHFENQISGVLPKAENDENNRVDTRTADTLYQVKLGGSLSDGTDGYRNDWKAPKAKAAKNNESREIIWVTPEGEILKKVDGRGMKGWEKME